MGTAGSSSMSPPSSPRNSPPASLPERRREATDYLSNNAETYHREYTNENTRQTTRTNVSNVNDEPRSQGPSPYTTLRRDDWWNQRPSAPSLSNLRPPHQETLLTYATQMTGWQSAEGLNPSYSHQQHHEAMELSRVISQLAIANHQLASAHSATLGHLEALYTELRNERDPRRRCVLSSSGVESSDEALKKRLMEEGEQKDEEIDEGERLNIRIDNTERNLIAENCNSSHNKQRNHRQEEVEHLQHRIERLESIMKTQGFMKYESNDSTESYSCIPDNEDTVMKGESNVNCVNPEEIPTSVLNSFIVPESEVNSESSKSQTEDAVRSIETKRLKLGQEEADSAHRQEILRLTKEIERLKDEGLEYQSTNERLFSDLEARGVDIKKLTLDYERIKAQCEVAESSLSERSSECDELIKKFDAANKEIERLRKEIDAQNFKKDTAQSRISSLEQGISSLEQVLQKTISEKDEIINAESEKNSKLKAQLEEETADRKKQMKALEDALDEIQRLKETIKTEGKNNFDELPKEDISVLESSEDPQQSSSGDRISNLDEFKKELTVKREARQRAIAAVSSEMERLRRELDAEKEAHSETSRMLELLRSGQGCADTQVNIALDGRRFRIKEQKPDEHEIAMKKAEALRLNKILKVSDELRNDIRFQIEKVDDLRYHLESDRENHRPRIRSLTEVTSKAREAVSTRERRANVLKDHLAQILVRLGDRSFLLDCHDDVAGECERQVENINSLKSLYNERLKVLTDLKDTAMKELTDVKERLEYSLKQTECLEEDLKKADEKIDTQDTEISSLESQLGLAKADCRDLQNQMSLINGLFTQMLLGASSADMDLDRLTQLLQENHDLISDMAKEESTEAAALPKLLLDLVEQVKGSKSSQNKEEEEENENEMEKKEDDLQQEDIAHNLPKVWRVLFELLSCHAVGAPTASAVSSSDPNTCYKSVDTPAGPRLVISVSKTYIRLKELILEKKHLEKEMNRMKQLNTHLESKLGEQEKRLSTVSAELTKTWNIVDRMQAQHQQLHTHEKILRYELQQKRKMLQELKQELEYCREKWESARQKNTNTELEWRSLRREFAARKALAVHDSFNNSAESGFSDERGDDTDEEDESVEGRIRLGPRKRSRKESQRIPASDTESEQPTDTELSESKTGSSSTLEKRTPSPETEAELDEIEGVDTEILDKNVLEREASPDTVQEPMDPLDQALTNVIQNLIKMDNTSEMNIQFLNSDDLIEDSEDSEIQKMASIEQSTEEPDTEMDCQMKEDLTDKIDKESYDSETIKLPEDSINKPEPSVINEDLPKGRHTDGETTEAPPFVSHTPVTSSPSLTSTMSVFSIGPVPQPITTLLSIKSVQFSEPLIVGPSNRFFAPVFGSSAPDSCHLTDNTAISLPSNCSTSIREADEVGIKTFSEKHVSKSPEGLTDTDNVSVDSSSSLETVKEFPTANSLATVLTLPASSLTTYGSDSCSASTALSALPQQDEATVKSKTRTPEEALAAREDRLKRLEEQADWLMKKMNATSRRGSALSSRLEELHEVYGEPPVPPPMPDVLPSRRLRTNLTDLPPQVPESSSASSAKNSEKPFSGRISDESPPDNAP